MTDQQMHERLEAAGARWREDEPVVRGFEPPSRQHALLTRGRVGWLVTAAAVLAATAGIAIPLASGGGTTQPPAGTTSELYGVRWTWSGSSLNGPRYRLPSSFDLASTPHLRFSTNGRVAGSDGCNTLAGPVQVRGNRLTFGSLGGTFTLCQGPMGKISAGIDNVLRGQVTWRIVCNTLMLSGHTGELDFDAPHRTAADIRCMQHWSRKHAVK